MRFYEIDNALQEAICAADKPVRLKIEIELNGHFQSIFEQDIIEANFYSIKEVSGGVSSRGEIFIDNFCNFLTTCGGTGAGLQVKVLFSIGEGLPFFNRFNFYVDDKGIQEINGPGRKKFVYFGLQDFSYKLRKTDETKDWTSQAVFTYSVVCDKSQPPCAKTIGHSANLRGENKHKQVLNKAPPNAAEILPAAKYQQRNCIIAALAPTGSV